jgi:hypothetical protein
MLRKRVLIGAAIAALAIVGAYTAIVAPRGPAPLPPGAARLDLRTQPSTLWPPPGLGCPAVLVLPLRVELVEGAIAFSVVDDGARVSVSWPAGFSARLLDGRAELVTPDGEVLARDGDVISNLAGSAADNGDILVCISSAYAPEVTHEP